MAIFSMILYIGIAKVNNSTKNQSITDVRESCSEAPAHRAVSRIICFLISVMHTESLKNKGI